LEALATIKTRLEAAGTLNASPAFPVGYPEAFAPACDKVSSISAVTVGLAPDVKNMALTDLISVSAGVPFSWSGMCNPRVDAKDGGLTFNATHASPVGSVMIPLSTSATKSSLLHAANAIDASANKK
jgi:hypothetical protein